MACLLAGLLWCGGSVSADKYVLTGDFLDKVKETYEEIK